MALQMVGCLCILLAVNSVKGVAEVDNNPPRIQHLVPRIDFYPQELKQVVEKEHRVISFGINWESSNDSSTGGHPHQGGDFLVKVVSEDPSILGIVNSSFPSCIRAIDEPKNFSFTVKAVFLGYTKVKVSMKTAVEGCDGDGTDLLVTEDGGTTRNFELVVSVIRAPSFLVNTVTGIFAALVAFNYVNMGVQLDLECIGKVLKRPVGPIIGFVCQFLFMPVASWGISVLLLDDISLRLGLFTLGCSPGGSMSNFWTLLFNGDVNLSITMTFISTVAALAMMPLWIFTLGRTLFRDNDATIPYINLAGSLVLLTLPIGIGLLIRHKSPRLTKISHLIIKPFTIVICLLGIGLGLYANSFVFSYFTWQVVVAGLGIAWGGYCFGALAAFVFRLDRAQIVAVSIETAFQNPAVAFVMLLLSLPQPDADLSSVPVTCQLLLTGIPMWFLLLWTRGYRRVRGWCEDGLETGKIEKPELDTLQKAYMAVETSPPPEDREDIALESARWKKVDIVRFSS